MSISLFHYFDYKKKFVYVKLFSYEIFYKLILI